MNKVCITKDNLIIIHPRGDLDHHVIEGIRNEIDEEITSKRIYRLAFDFRDVGFMDSSGIGLIMGRYKKIRGAGGEIFVCNLNCSMQRIFKLSGLFRITSHSFEIDRIVKEATYEQDKNGI
ncbi:MAG: anti-sigma factor antagonist [Butyrivibrio sp.]